MSMSVNRGTVRYSGYKTGGRVKCRGLRNKRAAYYRKVHEAEAKVRKDQKQAKLEAKREKYREYNQYEEYV